jgi:hypothetical protein
MQALLNQLHHAQPAAAEFRELGDEQNPCHRRV